MYTPQFEPSTLEFKWFRYGNPQNDEKRKREITGPLKMQSEASVRQFNELRVLYPKLTDAYLESIGTITAEVPMREAEKQEAQLDYARLVGFTNEQKQKRAEEEWVNNWRAQRSGFDNEMNILSGSDIQEDEAKEEEDRVDEYYESQAEGALTDTNQEQAEAYAERVAQNAAKRNRPRPDYRYARETIRKTLKSQYGILPREQDDIDDIFD